MTVFNCTPCGKPHAGECPPRVPVAATDAPEMSEEPCPTCGGPKQELYAVCNPCWDTRKRRVASGGGLEGQVAEQFAPLAVRGGPGVPPHRIAHGATGGVRVALDARDLLSARTH